MSGVTNQLAQALERIVQLAAPPMPMDLPGALTISHLKHIAQDALHEYRQQKKLAMVEPPEEKRNRNFRVQFRYDQLMHEGRHGHYETMFMVVREEVERAKLIWTSSDPTEAKEQQ